MFTLILEYLVVAIYLICLMLIVLYSIGQLHLVFTFYKHRKNYQPEPPLQGDKDLPFVTIQLPIYNELYVVDRLLEATAGQDYPKACFDIQVLDDSDDETVEIIAKKVAELKERGIQIEHIRRPTREGYKAGALGYGLDFAKGDFIAIFDADFVPQPQHLRVAMAQFTSDEIGVVQARWEHINQHYSLFTEIQAFHLDAHFTIEQFSRCFGGYYMNFNGTAGVWRKETILDAGGWEADTLTEDLDLSYRAQIKGWKFRYIDELGAPAELPAEMGAIKSQQYRWMKGGAEVARKMLKKVWQSDASLARKLHGTLHLLSSSVFMIVLILGAMSVPLLYVKHSLLEGKMGLLVFPISLLIGSFIILAIFYLATMLNREKSLGKSLKRLFLHYIPFLALSMGLSLHNTIAVLQGLWGKKTPFIRTPKFNIIQKKDEWQTVKYRARKVKPSVYGELFMALYFSLGIYLAFYFDDMAILPFLIMQFLGFAVIGFFSFKHALSR
jgi:cellulose synthase/poly-beta-1,6-N-acetylglucosamine synthase-like glycosyltransferase